jgi:hypothetical protein
MARPTESAALAKLSARWRQWTEAVEKIARRQSRRRYVEPNGYERLHKELLNLCDHLAREADAPHRSFFEYLGEMARPWLTLRVLEQADREILLWLHSSCVSAERRLTGSRRYHWRRGLRIALKVGATGCVLVAVSWASFRFWTDLRLWWRNLAHALLVVYDRIGFEWLLLGGFGLVLVAVLVVSYSRRS